jgi:type IV secretion system protein VirB6
MDNFLVILGQEIDRITHTFVFDGYNALASFLKAPLASCIVLYIVLMGYALARGLIDKPAHELIKFCFKLGIIYMTAMNWAFFAEHMRDLFVIGSESISSKLMQALDKGRASSSVNQGLQTVLNEILSLGLRLFDLGTWRKPTPYLAGMMVFLSGAITVGLAFIEIVVAKLMMAITLATAPLFISFILYEQTKSLFERWLNLLIGFSCVLIFVSSVIGLCMHMLHWITASLLKDTTTVVLWIPLLIVSCLCVLCIFQAVSMGKSIGSSLVTSGGTDMAKDLKRGMSNVKNSAAKSMRHVKKAASSAGSYSGSNSNPVIDQIQQNLRRGKA